MARNESNYLKAQETVKCLTDPINYMMEHGDGESIPPKRFNVKQGLCRIDHTGNALLKNVVSETGKFSNLEAFSFKVN